MVKETVKVTRASLAMLTVFGAMVAAGCSDNNDNLAALVGTFITANAGSSGQTGVAGTALASPISVLVTDQNNNALAGVTVSWAVVGAGGSVSAATSVTDLHGNASTIWTVGTAVGTDSLVASIPIGASVTITANVVASPTQLVKISGDNQTVTAGTNSQPLQVRVENANGIGIAGATVTWAITSAGGGALSASSTTTDANGNTSVVLATSATPGTATVVATGPGGAIQTFTIVGAP
jgi:adhesin/invasin